MTLDEVRRLAARNAAPLLEVHAVDPMIYVVFARSGERLEPVRDQRGRSLQFRSRHAAVTALRETGVASAEFLHQSAYGEMVGLDNEPRETVFRETIQLARPDD